MAIDISGQKGNVRVGLNTATIDQIMDNLRTKEYVDLFKSCK